MNALSKEEKAKIIIEQSKKHDITAYEFGKNTDISTFAADRLLTGKTENPSNKTLNQMLTYIESKIVGTEIGKNLEEEKTDYQPGGKLINEDQHPKKAVFVIPIKGRGGLQQAYYDDLAIKQLDIEHLTLKEPSSNGSKWFKVEVEGVSMDDSTEDFEGSKFSLCEGDWAYCRSIPKMHWRNKLHFNKVKVFCFFHNTRGIIFKKVKDHNTETGELLLTSLNKDKKQFPDFSINVAECSYICNVIKVLSEF